MKAQQITEYVEPQQTDVIAYSPSAQSVTTQGFLDMLSALPTMMMMFFMMMLMGLMREVMQPGGAKRVISTGAKAAAPALALIPYAGPALSSGVSAVGQALEEPKE